MRLREEVRIALKLVALWSGAFRFPYHFFYLLVYSIGILHSQVIIGQRIREERVSGYYSVDKVNICESDVGHIAICSAISRCKVSATIISFNLVVGS